MPRVARIVVADCPHHVTQRGNNRQDVFFVDDDRRAYLAILAGQCRRCRVAIVGYCVRPLPVGRPRTPKAGRRRRAKAKTG